MTEATTLAPHTHRSDISSAIFGLFDGTVSVLGVILGLAVASPHVVVSAAVGLAVASSVGMGAGQYLGDRSRRIHLALVMAGATVVGTLAPLLPFAFARGSAAILGALAVGCVAAALIGRARRRMLETFVVFVVAMGATIGASVLLGGS